MANFLQQIFLLLAVLVVTVGVTGLIGSNVLSQIGTIAGNTSDAYQMVDTVIDAAKSTTSWIQIVFVVLIGAYLIRLVGGFGGAAGSP